MSEIKFKKLFSQGAELYEIEKDRLASEIIADLPIHESLKQEIVVIKDGEVVSTDTFIEQDSLTAFVHVPAGGGDGKNPLATIAMLAVAAFAFSVGSGMIFGLTGMQASMASAGIMIVGALLIGALFPPPTPDDLDQRGLEQNYTITGQQNRIRQYQSLPFLYGEHYFMPDVAAMPIVMTHGNDDYLYAIYNFGYGRVDISDLKIGDTPFIAFKDAEYRIYKNYKGKGGFAWYRNDMYQEGHSIVLRQDEEHIIGTADQSDKCIVDISFSRGLRYVDRDSGASYQATVQHDIYWKKESEVDWHPLAETNAWFSRGTVTKGTRQYFIEFDGQIYNNCYWDCDYEGNCNTVCDTFWRLLQGQNFGKVARCGYIDNGREVIAPVPANTIINLDGEYLYTTNDASVGQNVYFNRNLNSEVRTAYEEEHCSGWWADDYECWTEKKYVRYYGSEIASPSFWITELSYKPFTLSVTIDFPSEDKYLVKVVRRTPYYESDSYYLDQSAIRGITSLRNRPPIDIDVPITLVEIKIKASEQLSGAVDTLNGIGKRWVKVWDGTNWVDAFSNNPAWIYVDILCGEANARPLSYSRLDLDSIIEFADFCDSNGYTCNFVGTGGTTTVWQLCKNVLATGRGSPTVVDGKYSVIFDKPGKLPVQVFSPRNARNFRATRILLDEPHCLRVKYIDPNFNWQQNILNVYNDGYDETNTTKYDDLELFGITNHDLAWKHGRYFMAEAILRQETFTLTSDLENIICTRGDLVEIQYDVPKLGGKPGRIRKINGSLVQIDEAVREWIDPVCLIRTKDFELIYRDFRPAGTFTVEILGEMDSISIGDLIVMGERKTVTAKFLLSAVRPAKDLSADLTFVPEAKEIYDSDKGEIPEWKPIVTNPPEIVLPGYVSYKGISEFITFYQRRPVIHIKLDWAPPISNFNGVYYVNWYDENIDQWILLDVVKEPNYDHTPAPEGVGTIHDIVGKEFKYKVQAATVDGKRRPLDMTPVVSIIPEGDTIAPPSPDRFDINIINNSIQFTWNLVDAPDVAGYRIRYNPDTENVDFNYSTILISLTPWDSNTATVNARIGTYFITAVDTSGNESEDIVAVSTTIPDLIELNTIAIIDDAPTDWNGSYSQMVKRTGGIALQNITADTYYEYGTYQFSTILDLSEIYTVRLSSFVKATPEGTGVSADWDVTTEVRTTIGNLEVIADWVRMSDIDPIAPGSRVEWTEWMEFYAGEFTGRFLQFRIKCRTVNSYRGIFINEAQINVDMPDRIESDDDVVCPAGGMIITYDPAFRVSPAVAISAQTMTEGDYYILTAKSRNGFTIEFRDAGNQPVERTFDWMARGYGRVMPVVLDTRVPHLIAK